LVESANIIFYTNQTYICNFNYNSRFNTYSINKKRRLTGVWQDYEFGGKYTFTFRKKFYL
jgi:hypothetical protein